MVVAAVDQVGSVPSVIRRKSEVVRRKRSWVEKF